MANGMSVVPSLGRISRQISDIYDNLYSMYGTRRELAEDPYRRRDAEVAQITITIEQWQRRVEQLEAIRERMRAAADRAAEQMWAEAAQASATPPAVA